MAKITVLEQKTYQGKPSGFKVTLDDGRTGNLEEKKSDQNIRVGDEVVVEEIPYVSKTGNKSTLYGLRLVQQIAAQPSAPVFTPVPQSQLPKPLPHVGGGISALDIFNAKLDMNKSIFEAVLQQLADGKFDDARAAEKLEFYRNYFENVIDVLAKGK